MAGGSRYKIVVEGREHEVTVEPSESGVDTVTVDGERFEVSPAPDGAALVRPLGDGARGSHTQHLVTLDGAARPSMVGIAGHGLSVSVQTAREAALEQARALRGGGAGSLSRVDAPMPGRVVRVLVAEGDAVNEGDPVIIVEAMKMENEMYAPMTGRIRAIAVSEGDTVDGGQLLCELEPHQDSEPPA